MKILSKQKYKYQSRYGYKIGSEEKENNSSISLPHDGKLEENETDAPEIAGIISQQEVIIELNNNKL